MQFTRDIRRVLQRKAVDTEAMALLWGAILDGSLNAVEIGAVVGALAAAGEARSELAGLYRAARARITRWSPPVQSGIVSMAAYGLVPGEAVVVSLACALLRRFEIPVVIHGMLDSPCGVSTASVLRELSVLPCASFAQADEKLAAEGVAFLPGQLVSPAFASLIALRGRLGIENIAHLVAPALDPTQGLATRLTFSADDTLSERFEALSGEADGDSVAARWPPGRSPLSLSIRPRIERVRGGLRDVWDAPSPGLPIASARRSKILSDVQAMAIQRLSLVG